MRIEEETKLYQLKCNTLQLINGLLGMAYIAITVWVLVKIAGLFI